MSTESNNENFNLPGGLDDAINEQKGQDSMELDNSDIDSDEEDPEQTDVDKKVNIPSKKSDKRSPISAAPQSSFTFCGKVQKEKPESKMCQAAVQPFNSADGNCVSRQCKRRSGLTPKEFTKAQAYKICSSMGFKKQEWENDQTKVFFNVCPIHAKYHNTIPLVWLQSAINETASPLDSAKEKILLQKFINLEKLFERKPPVPAQQGDQDEDGNPVVIMEVVTEAQVIESLQDLMHSIQTLGHISSENQRILFRKLADALKTKDKEFNKEITTTQKDTGDSFSKIMDDIKKMLEMVDQTTEVEISDIEE